MLRLNQAAPSLRKDHSQAARSTKLRPVSLRRQWAEHPSPLFLICLLLVCGGLAAGLAGLFGWLTPPKHLTPESATTASLIGTSATRAREMLGPPTLIRHEPPAEVWQYRSKGCVLDLYVYTDSTPALVRYAESRTTDPGYPCADRVAGK